MNASQSEKPPTSEPTEKDARHTRAVFIAICMSLPIAWTTLVHGVVHAVVQPSPVPEIVVESEYGSISSPESGAAVGKSFQLKGTFAPPPTGHEVWLVTEKDGRIWPKANLGSAGGEISQKFTEGADRYYLRVLQLDRAGTTVFKQWRKTANETGQWPGIEEPPNSIEVARIKLRQQ